MNFTFSASRGVPQPSHPEHAVTLFCIASAILQSKRVTPELLMSRLPLLSQVVDLASAYYCRRDSSPVFPHVTPEQLRKAFGAGAPMPEGEQHVGQSIAALVQSAELGLVAHPEPRY